MKMGIESEDSSQNSVHTLCANTNIWRLPICFASSHSMQIEKAHRVFHLIRKEQTIRGDTACKKCNCIIESRAHLFVQSATNFSLSSAFFVQKFDKVLFCPSILVLDRFTLAFREEFESGETLYLIFFGQGGILFIVGVYICHNALQR